MPTRSRRRWSSCSWSCRRCTCSRRRRRPSWSCSWRCRRTASSCLPEDPVDRRVELDQRRVRARGRLLQVVRDVDAELLGVRSRVRGQDALDDRVDLQRRLAVDQQLELVAARAVVGRHGQVLGQAERGAGGRRPCRPSSPSGTSCRRPATCAAEHVFRRLAVERELLAEMDDRVARGERGLAGLRRRRSLTTSFVPFGFFLVPCASGDIDAEMVIAGSTAELMPAPIPASARAPVTAMASFLHLSSWGMERGW